MGKPKVRLDGFAPTLANDAKRTGVASKGSVGSRTWSNSTSANRPTNKAKGTNAKLIGSMTSLNFDGNDLLNLSTVEPIGSSDNWMFVIAFVDLDTSSDNTLLGFDRVSPSNTDGYLQIAAGGNGVILRPATPKRSEVTTAINNTDNSSTNYTFGNDVEVLILYQTGGQHFYYNIDGDLIGQTSVDGGFSQQCSFAAIGGHTGGTESLNAQLLDVKIYTGSDVPPVTTESLQAIGNNYKQLKD